MTKEETAQNEQFLLLPQCFPLLVIGYPFNYRDFLFFDKICAKPSAAGLMYEGKGYTMSCEKRVIIMASRTWQHHLLETVYVYTYKLLLSQDQAFVVLCAFIRQKNKAPAHELTLKGQSRITFYAMSSNPSLCTQQSSYSYFEDID